ncbi:uncharacterized protein LOC131935318 [Physella acuta]|uniref:uncharacterized protein LOC131935318 n=1 Tax=Physella acuta TaxID=109671 RepID=UPI0027DAFF21|nr:uncharacterized protein LOC131935318 [Physella acuta]
MPGVKRKRGAGWSRPLDKAKGARIRTENESPENITARLKTDRGEGKQKKLNNETDEERLQQAKRSSRATKAEEYAQRRRERDAAIKRQKRKNETKDETEARRQTDAKRHAIYIANETAKETEARRQTAAKRHAISVANETAKETEARRQTDAKRHAISVANETAKETQARRQTDAKRHAISVSNETVKETQVRRQRDAERHALAVENESLDETLRRKQQDNERHKQAIARETLEERQTRQTLDAARFRERRANVTQEQRAQNTNRMRQNRNRMTDIPLAWTDFDDFDESDVQIHDCGHMDQVCEKCRARFFPKERPTDKMFTVCCNKGTIELPQFESHEYLKNLMLGHDRDSNIFMEHIRSYNSAFAFVSVGAKIDFPRGRGPFTFRIHGQVYHRSGTLHPTEGVKPVFAQLYVLDKQVAISERLDNAANANCRRHIMETLYEVMKENPFSLAYRMMYEVEREETERAIASGEEIPKITMRLIQDRDQDQRRYNAQHCNEVAVVFTSSDGEPPLQRDLMVYLRADGENVQRMQQVSILHRNLDALCYPLLFPKGEQGWGEELRLTGSRRNSENTRTRVSLKMYYSYYLQVRDYFNPLLSAGRLTQQYIVDAYVKAESNDLNFIRTHQKQLRCDTYKHLIPFIQNEDNDSAVPGRRVILPSTFSGSPRNMQQLYQDAMAIVRKFGKPDFFVTMTCNPKWPEIEESLLPGQRPENRPDIVDRVFKLKLQQLLKDISEKKIFGRVVALVHVIEFQKRGLPHAHIVITVEGEFKPRTSTIVNKVVVAELPDKEKFPRLFHVISSNMIHGPCGVLNPQSTCMVNGKCSKKFPKKFSEETKIVQDGYPIYMRRKNEPVTIGKHSIDNSWIVPYNAYLSLKYECHINVEICESFSSIKYLFKYAYKGTDSANVQVTADEIKTHLDSRYVSPPEAMWRIFRFKMHDQTHAIIRLPIHLEGDPYVTFDPDNIRQVVESVPGKDTRLTAWFKLNTRDENAKRFKYHEIPEHYVFQEKEGVWTPRKRLQGRVIGRILPVNINDTERYFMRLLLLHVPGVTSFEYLRKVERISYDSYYKAAKERGLVIDENVWNETLAEACIVAMPKEARALFAYMCLYCEITDASNLWNQHRARLIEDFALRHGHPAEADCDMCDSFGLNKIEEILIGQEKRCKNYHLPTPNPNHIGQMNEYIDREQESMLGQEMEANLNEKQRAAFDAVMEAVNDHTIRSKCFFLDGPGGTGKTYLYDTLLHTIRGKGQSMLAVASTGIAANLLNNGKTYHSQFGLPFKLNETSVSRFTATSTEAEKIRKAVGTLMDEASMCPALAAECINKLYEDITISNIAFGGKVFLAGGDFRQCLPVVPGAEPAEVVLASLKHSKLWDEFKILKLDLNVRSVDPEYSNWLLKLGNGELGNDFDLGEDIIEIP